ncbi:MAG: ATP-binding protein [Pseudobdellovibrionaceae bacterium]
MLSNDESGSYDRRFELRGDQKANQQIVLIQIDQQDTIRIDPLLKNIRQYGAIPLLDIASQSDSIFWDRHLWKILLDRLIRAEVSKVAVSLFFEHASSTETLTNQEKQIFLNPKIIWSSRLNMFDRVDDSSFSLPNHSNVGTNELRKDDDNIYRRVPQPKPQISHLIEKFTGQGFPQGTQNQFINFRGKTSLFRSYNLSTVMDPHFPIETLKGKYILIGPKRASDSQFMTPLGMMSKTEIFAHMTDNLLEDRWIARLPFVFYALALLGLIVLAASVITQYPHSVTFFVYLWIGTLTTALSTWAFDSFSIWFPVGSPLISLGSVWLIFIGHQATKIEKKHFKLQQEQQALRELEQLKNNFVSLISHDLKTPLAKIEAITQRLKQDTRLKDYEKDFLSLQESNEELNRYLQSVLKVLRVESRDMKLNPQPVDLNELIEKVFHQIQPLAQTKNIEIVLKLEPLFLVEIDATLIQEVLLNLLDNAVKYTPPDRKILVKSFENEGDVEVQVIDQGEGISQEEADLVWQKFVRGKNQDLKTKGSGLGLYLVKYFVELHGGTVHMQSMIGQGTTVRFTLPFELDSDSNQPQIEQ